ncbi:L-threonine O-3-phosphate decarboxylase [Rhizobium sp. NFR07]|uniref:threonine-phosphate decarboxylase CobD n=1 Tax=Rhizobium sp. NFR07 TaxID=1566262 RepID=UPI0008E6F9BC|nr:threonine-phosphate decarboxylase CobD [Rhizobium sp. NFR07]SFB53833.1 L-threonine O-3-phosphate decarboxylase [Rhizobium sp. NFR07]
MAGSGIENGVGDAIQHGGNLARARALFPQAPEPWIDLSTGINPHSYPHSPIPGNVFARLPEPASLDSLKTVAANAYGAPSAAHIAGGPGTQILLPIVAGLVDGRKAAVLSPTYAEHARAAKMAGFDVTETDDVDRLTEADLAVIVNPNNPTGRIVQKEEIIALAARMRAKGGMLIVDEAFMDVSDGTSVTGIAGDGGLLVLRSFGKFYGMAGLRIGFAISRPDIVRQIEERLGPWAISGPALHVAGEALSDYRWQVEMRQRLGREAAELELLLRGAGIGVFGGTSLFCLVRDPRAQSLFRHLGERGIITRRFDERPDDLRIGLPDEDGWARLGDALKAF